MHFFSFKLCAWLSPLVKPAPFGHLLQNLLHEIELRRPGKKVTAMQTCHLFLGMSFTRWTLSMNNQMCIVKITWPFLVTAISQPSAKVALGPGSWTNVGCRCLHYSLLSNFVYENHGAYPRSRPEFQVESLMSVAMISNYFCCSFNRTFSVLRMFHSFICCQFECLKIFNGVNSCSWQVVFLPSFNSWTWSWMSERSGLMTTTKGFTTAGIW